VSRWRRLFGGGAEQPDAVVWQRVAERLPAVVALAEEERPGLQHCAARFLERVNVEGAHGLAVTPEMAAEIALQACLPVRHRGLEHYVGWRSVILHPGEFVVDHEEMDEAGVVHRVHEARSGEAWETGPVILSWEDVLHGRKADGYNVVLHEAAHKLDGDNGALNGYPPLPPWMTPAAWSRAFSDAYKRLEQREEAGREGVLDPYALTAPAEFFAVATEAFFELPAELEAEYPAVCAQLAALYGPPPEGAR